MNRKLLPSQEELLNKYIYFPETGLLKSKSWFRKNGELLIDSPEKLGNINSLGYLTLNGFYIHRLIWKMVYNKEPELIDHRNGIPDDNRLFNLRSCTVQQNSQNSKKPINNTSGYKGVSWSKSKNKWKASIRVNKCLKHLGFFNDPKEAYQAYCKAAQLYFGEFARLE